MNVRGVYVPLLTPLRASGEVALEAIEGCVDRLLGAGVHGLVALGTTGEFADLTGSERAAVAAAVVEAAGGRVPVLAGVGAVGTTEACEHARAASAAGADGLLVLPPLYWKLGEDELVAHFARVAEASDVPVLLYDFPELSGTPLLPPLVERVAKEVPQVAGVKLSGKELPVAHGVLTRVKPERPDFSVMMGAVELVLPGLLAGADGTIAAIANVAPRVVVELLAAFESGDLETAQRLHRQILALLAVPRLTVPSILALKVAAAACGAPLEPVVRTAPAGAADALDRAGALATSILARQ